MEKTASAPYLELKLYINEATFKDRYPLLIIKKITYSANFEEDIGEKIEINV